MINSYIFIITKAEKNLLNVQCYIIFDQYRFKNMYCTKVKRVKEKPLPETTTLMLLGGPGTEIKTNVKKKIKKYISFQIKRATEQNWISWRYTNKIFVKGGGLEQVNVGSGYGLFWEPDPDPVKKISYPHNWPYAIISCYLLWQGGGIRAVLLVDK